MKILYFATEDFYFCSHRLPVARAAKKNGYSVFVITNVNNYADAIINEGFKLIPLSTGRGSLNPFKEIIMFVKLVLIMRNVNPDIVHNIALKPIFYGSIAAKFIPKVKIINAYAGLGISFNRRGLKGYFQKKIISFLLFLVQKSNNSFALFQNPDDLEKLCCMKITTNEKSILIKGSGVNISKFKPLPKTHSSNVILLASRLLWSKGIGDFVKVAKLLKNKNVHFVLVGSPDNTNSDAVPKTYLEKCHDKGYINWKGKRTNMVAELQKADIVLFPSLYGEGIPKFLLEAASCGLPIVTYNMPGCREIVQDKINGFLVKPKDIESLATNLKKLINDNNLCKEMGMNGRILVKRNFSDSLVAEQTLKLYNSLTNEKNTTNWN